jgi:outer membrane receptor for ferrienterochelin and colicins
MDVFVQETNEDGKPENNPQVYAPKWSGTYSFSYPIKKWATYFDLTGTFTGPMRLPVFPNDFRPEYSPWYSLLNLQVTKKFNHIELYVSGKNLLNFIPDNPILHPDDPFDRPGGRYWLANGDPNPVTNPNGFTFDPSYNYAPMQGFRLLFGCRISIH